MGYPWLCCYPVNYVILCLLLHHEYDAFCMHVYLLLHAPSTQLFLPYCVWRVPAVSTLFYTILILWCWRPIVPLLHGLFFASYMVLTFHVPTLKSLFDDQDIGDVVSLRLSLHSLILFHKKLPLTNSIEFLWSMFSLKCFLWEMVVRSLPNPPLFSSWLETGHGCLARTRHIKQIMGMRRSKMLRGHAQFSPQDPSSLICISLNEPWFSLFFPCSFDFLDHCLVLTKYVAMDFRKHNYCYIDLFM